MYYNCYSILCTVVGVSKHVTYNINWINIQDIYVHSDDQYQLKNNIVVYTINYSTISNVFIFHSVPLYF